MKIRMAMAVAAIALTPSLALAQSATQEGARDGAATGHAIGGPVGGAVGGTVGAAVGTAVDIPAGGTVTFQPGGRHVMLYNMNPGVKPGRILSLLLTFSDGTRLRQGARVIAAGDPAPTGS